MSFLKIGDRAAGAIKSGGTTRRAAKMVTLDLDHPEIMDFIKWKKEEEQKVAALLDAGYASDNEGEAYATVSGQNSNKIGSATGRARVLWVAQDSDATRTREQTNVPYKYIKNI